MSATSPTTTPHFHRTLGLKNYEISNHPARAGQVLGNVTATVSDAKTTTFNGEVGYTTRINTLTDYYPFGMMMSGRSFDEAGYGYGFQGQETDDEIKGEGNSINYKYRMHDARIGRFFAVDPLAASFPWNSSYAFSENRVVDAVELEGLEQVSFHQKSWTDSDGNRQSSTTERGTNHEGQGNEGFYGSQIITNDDGTTFSAGSYFPPVEISIEKDQNLITQNGINNEVLNAILSFPLDHYVGGYAEIPIQTAFAGTSFGIIATRNGVDGYVTTRMPDHGQGFQFEVASFGIELGNVWSTGDASAVTLENFSGDMVTAEVNMSLVIIDGGVTIGVSEKYNEKDRLIFIGRQLSVGAAPPGFSGGFSSDSKTEVYDW
ncbi:MAG: hypothetical protein GC193_12600 [Cryomorphaceae bacterium]|nr:hypothetical protein [Cryomorphaceae bacterium]